MTHCGLEKSEMDCSAGRARPPPLTADPYLYPLATEERKDLQDDQGNSKITEGWNRLQQYSSRWKQDDDAN